MILMENLLWDLEDKIGTLTRFQANFCTQTKIVMTKAATTMQDQA